MERVIQSLPGDAAAFVRNKNPTTMYEACDYGTQFFSNSDRDVAQYYGKPYQHELEEARRRNRWSTQKPQWNNKSGHPYRDH